MLQRKKPKQVFFLTEMHITYEEGQRMSKLKYHVINYNKEFKS